MKKIKITKEQFNKITNVLKEGFPKLKTKPDPTDKAFQTAFANKNIKNLGEGEKFNLKDNPNIKNVSKANMGNFGKPLKESNGDLKSEALELIKNLYSFSDFWSENGLSYDEIYNALESKGLVIKEDGKYKLSKSLGSKEEAIQALENELSQMINGGEKEVSGEIDEEEHIEQINFAVVAFNDEFAILEGSDGDYYAFYYHEYKSDILEYVDAEKIDGELHKEPNGDEVDYDIDYTYADKEITAESIQEFINQNRGNLSVGEGLEGWNDGMDINKLDEELKDDILSIGYNENDIANKEFLTFLQNMTFDNESLNEMHGEDEQSFIQRKMSQGLSQKTAKSLYDIRQSSDRQDTERFANRDASNDTANKSAIDRLKTKVTPTQEPKKPIGQYRMQFNKGDREIDEMSLGGGAMGGTNTASVFGTSGPVPKFGEPLKKTLKGELKETTEGEGSIGAYDTPGGLTMDLGKNNPKTKAEKTPQWAGGEFVEQPECSKLNNNKEAQNGGCNVGATSLKTKKAKGSINAPSLGENKIYETIAKKTGKTIDEVKRIIESKSNKS